MFKKSYFLFITAPVWFLGIIKTNAPVPTILFLWLIKVYTCIVGLPVLDIVLKKLSTNTYLLDIHSKILSTSPGLYTEIHPSLPWIIYTCSVHWILPHTVYLLIINIFRYNQFCLDILIKKIIQITLLCWSSYIHTLFINISVSIDWILLHIRVIYQHLQVQLIILLSSIGSILDTHPKGVSPGYSPLDTSSSTDQIFNPLAQTAKRIITH